MTTSSGDHASPRRDAPIPVQGDLDERAETVGASSLASRIEGPTDELFAHRAFVRLWTSRLFGTTANQMLLVALGGQMYDLTSSAGDLAAVQAERWLEDRRKRPEPDRRTRE